MKHLKSAEVGQRAAEWLGRYKVADIAEVLDVSRPTASKIRAGELDWPAFLAFAERDGVAFVSHVLSPVVPGLKAGAGVVSLLRRLGAEIAAAVDEVEGDNVPSERPAPPTMVERRVADVPMVEGSPIAAWLTRWRRSAKLDGRSAVRLASMDPSGRVGVVRRGEGSPFFKCLHVGQALRFRNPSGLRLVGSTTADWSKDPYLASCERTYNLAAERGEPVIEDVEAAAGAGLAPTEPGYRRAVIPFRDRRGNAVVIVASEPLQAAHGGIKA
jgi:hypothetical protein